MMTFEEREDLRRYGGNLFAQALVLKERLKKINVDIELQSNAPWIYLHSVNGNLVKERYGANHGYCVGLSGRKGKIPGEFWDLKHLFQTIRKYLKEQGGSDG